MKKSILTVVFLSFFTNLFAQEVEKIDNLNYLVTYSMLHQVDSEDSTNKKQEKMILLIGDTMSKYQSERNYLKDSISAHHFENGTNLTPTDYESLPKTYQNYTIIKNRETATLTTTESIIMDNFEYEQPMSDIEWQLENESQMIAGYMCQKATLSYGGRDFVAWFTSQIPVQEGAYKFAGLPGFLVNISDTRGHSVIELVSITKNTEQEKGIYKFEEKRRTVKTTREKYIEAREKATKVSVLDNLTMSGIKVTFDDPAEGEKLKRKKFNTHNPIELE